MGVGGRTIPAEGGNIYDHFEINYLYPNGVRAFLANRQMVGCYNENSDYILGTEGTCTIGRGPVPRIEGKTNWTFSGKQYNMYQREHDVLFAAIRKNEPVNDGKRLATSTMLALMGRMAAYTGPAGHLGSGDEFTGEAGAGEDRLERQPRSAAARRTRRDEVVLEP